MPLWFNLILLIINFKCEAFKVLPSEARQVLNSRLYDYTLANQEPASEARQVLNSRLYDYTLANQEPASEASRLL